jgi:D-glycerate 3-kinase
VSEHLQSYSHSLHDFLRREQLPATYLDAIDKYFIPLADRIAARHANATLILGVQGGQGTGKSTLACVLSLLLAQQHGLRVVQLSLDDVYLTRAERRVLAARVHPLLATRGVPGTHDVALALATLSALKTAVAGETVVVPRFDKAQDDRCPRDRWDRVEGPVDVIVFEGWCVGASPQSADDLEAPVNALEAAEDIDGRWRRYVNAQLATGYRELFEQLDYLVALQASSFECIYRWRGLQEQKLAARLCGSRVMDEQQLARFIQHYERLTRHCLRELPARVDWLFTVDENHQISAEQEGLGHAR